VLSLGDFREAISGARSRQRHATTVALGPDGKSFRVFVSRIDGRDAEFFLQADAKDWTLVDATTASQWNFQGCAISGPRLESVSSDPRAQRLLV